MKTHASFNWDSILAIILTVAILDPCAALATQMHSNSEGILVHQMGHLFFLVSMAILIFTINGKELQKENGWKLIQYSAFLFILWNLDAIFAHFLDNQVKAVSVAMQGNWQMTIETRNNSQLLANAYYILKLDHLLCVPAIILFYLGLRRILAGQRQSMKKGDRA